MRSLFTALALICSLLINGVAAQARKVQPKQTKSRTERTASRSSVSQKETAGGRRESARREGRRESAREQAARRELIKRNPRLASLFKGEADEEMDRFDQPREALEWYLKKRLPKGEKQLPIERYFAAKDKIKKIIAQYYQPFLQDHVA